jgi:hypothetical protein
MDLSKFALLSTDALKKIKAEVDKLLDQRLDTRVMRGRYATFRDNEGGVRRVHIDKINQKTASCSETGDSLVPGHKWKVGLGLLNVEPVERLIAPVKPTRPVAPHRPATQTGEVW